MSSDLVNNNEAVNDAKIALKAAHGLREYALSGDVVLERQLLEMLSQRPTLMQRFFPTKGQVINNELMIQQLRTLAQNRKELSQIHHNALVQSLKTIVDVELFELETKGEKRKAEIVNKIALEMQLEITDSHNKQEKDLLEREIMARKDYADEPDYLERALKKLRITSDVNMKLYEKLVTGTIDVIERKRY